MQKKGKISKAEIEPLLSYMNNIEVKLQEACGSTVAVELRMRLIGQFSQPVRDKITELIKDWKAKNPNSKKKPSNNYWNCDLRFLDEAIVDTFQSLLSPVERQAFLEFRDLRNSLLHADFVALMIQLKIQPKGRQILSINGDKNTITSEDIEEAIKSVNTNNGLTAVRQKANEMITILDKLLRAASI